VAHRERLHNAAMSHFPLHRAQHKAQRQASVLQLVLPLRLERGMTPRKTSERLTTLRNNWARSLFDCRTTRLSPSHDLNISCFMDRASLLMPTHTCMQF